VLKRGPHPARARHHAEPAEAAALLDAPVARNEIECASKPSRLLALGPQSVLIKGGHAAAPRAPTC